jgi:hypothetical protein
MGCVRYSKTLLSAGRDFLHDMRAALSVELLFALPLLIWAYLGMVIFQDAFRAKMQSEAAAQHIADAISRNTETITVAYLEGMNDVFDFLTDRTRETRLRISSVMLNPETGGPQVAWSHGTRGLSPLVDLASTSFTGGDGIGFGSSASQAPIDQLMQRVPVIMPGETLILVETFSLWNSPVKRFLGLTYLDDMRLTPISVTRPRFTPFIRFENDNDVFPSDPPETPISAEPPETAVEPEQPTEEEPIAVTLAEFNFTEGVPPGWENAIVNSGPNYNFLGPFANETRLNPVTFRLQSPFPLDTMRIEFELLVIGTWDAFWGHFAFPEGEFLMLQINGESIALDPFRLDRAPLFMNNRNTMAFRAEGQFHTHMYNIWNTNSAPGHNGQQLQVWKVVITVVSPASDMTLGFSANVDGDVHDESFGIRDFRVTGERLRTGAQQRLTPRPDPANFLGRDMYTEFPLHAGCPKVLSSAPSYTIKQTDLQPESARFRIRARGTQDISICPGFGGFTGFAHEPPTVVLNWVGQGLTGAGASLQIRTNDNNNGASCNAALLVRDGYGQWHYNRDISGTNLNARLQLGIAGTAPHYIWVLRENPSDCDTDIQFSLY